MEQHTFTGLWPQTPGNPPAQFTWEGSSPTHAIVRQWATCLPDTTMGSPLVCLTDGVTYHLSLNADGMREIKTIATPTQFRSETI